jgi:hypothetical protein
VDEDHVVLAKKFEKGVKFFVKTNVVKQITLKKSNIFGTSM